MNCRKAERLISVWSDGEVDEGGAKELREHLEKCASCREKERTLQAAAAAMRHEFHAETPEGLADQAFRAAMSAEPVAATFLDSLFPIAWPAALVSSMAAASLVILSLVFTPPTASETTDPVTFVLAESSTQQVQGILQGALGVDIDGSYLGGTR